MVLAISIALLCAIPTWLLWNWLMPEIFGLKTLSFTEALGIFALCSCLFKSWNTSGKSKD